jgi:L-threonylcarbamoyladenylate synthase
MNPDVTRELTHCVQTLKNGGIIIFPDETGWSIGCELAGISKVNSIIEKYPDGYNEIILDDFGRMTKYCREIPEVASNLVEYSTRPLLLQVENALNVPANLLAEKNTASFRVVKDEFVNELVNKIYSFSGKPLFAKSLHLEGNPVKEETMCGLPCYVVNLRISPALNTDSLVIVRLSDGDQIKFIKK